MPLFVHHFAFQMNNVAGVLCFCSLHPWNHNSRKVTRKRLVLRHLREGQYHVLKGGNSQENQTKMKRKAAIPDKRIGTRSKFSPAPLPMLIIR